MKIVAGILLYHALAAAILCLPAIYNGYPIAYHDIGAYLKVGFRFLPDGDRFLGYGLFLRLATLGFTLWTVIFIQGLIVSLLLFRVGKKVFAGRSPYLFHLLVVITLTAGTGAGWFVSTPMPDIFAAGVILAVCLSLFEWGSSSPGLLFLLPLLLLFEVSHFSHILLAFFLIVALAAVLALSGPGRSYLLRLLPAFLTTVFAVFLLFAHNYFRGNGFLPSLSSNVFFVARLCDTPILERYLEENAGREELSLAGFRDRLPDSYSEFIWSRESPFRLVYGWASPTGAFRRANSEYGIIVGDILCTPRYLFPLLKENAWSTIRQLTRVRILEPSIIYTAEQAVYKAVNKYFPGENEEFLGSRQNRGALELKVVNRIGVAVMILSTAVIVFCLVSRGLGERAVILAWSMILGVVVNAAVTGSLAMVIDRLQSRVGWLIVFAGLICGRDWLIHCSKEGWNVRRQKNHSGSPGI